MGQSITNHIQDSKLLSQVAEVGDNLLFSISNPDINSISYEEFVDSLGKLNKLCEECLKTDDKQLLFVVKKGTTNSIFWKATVQIACVKMDPETQKVKHYRLLSLSEFLTVVENIKNCLSAAQNSNDNCEGGESSNASDLMTASTLFQGVDDVKKKKNKNSPAEKQQECCICLERKPEVILPCTHSYCLPCIEQWNVNNKTCPICREKLSSTDETWVLSEVPNAEEISEEIQSSLMKLSEEETPSCKTS